MFNSFASSLNGVIIITVVAGIISIVSVIVVIVIGGNKAKRAMDIRS